MLNLGFGATSGTAVGIPGYRTVSFIPRHLPVSLV